MWLTYLFCSEECLWVELRVSLIDRQWNDPPLAHIVTPAVTVEKFHKSLSYLSRLPLSPYLLPSPSQFSLPASIHPSPPLIVSLLINVIHYISVVVGVVRNHLSQNPLFFPIFCTYPRCNLKGWRGERLVKIREEGEGEFNAPSMVDITPS